MTKKSKILRPSSSLSLLALPLLGLMTASAHSAALAIVNAGFETDAAPVAGASGWTLTSTGGFAFFTTTTGAPDSTIDPDTASEGINWLSGNRLATGQGSTGTSGSQIIFQVVDLSADTALIDTGAATVDLLWQYADNDPADTGSVTISFFSDISGTSPLGSPLTTGALARTALDGTAPAPWNPADLSGSVPAGARSLAIQLRIDRASGTAGNVHFDAFSGSIVPEPGTSLLGLFGVLGLIRRRR